MQIIINNPYRIAGIYANASAKEIERQKSKIKKFASIGKSIDTELDFPFLPKIERSEEIINHAFSSLEQNQSKVTHSLFWFVNANPIDHTAIQHLINGNKEKAIEIWAKIIEGKEVNSKNFSAFNNIGTLHLLGQSDLEIKQGIETKIRFIESDGFKYFVHVIADETFSIVQARQVEILIDELYRELKNRYSSEETTLMLLFGDCDKTSREYLSKKITEKPAHEIESQIEIAKNKRKNDKSNAYQFGNQLYANCKKDLTLLKSIIGGNNLQYKILSDNLAKEIMQCGIDYFNEWQNSKNPSKESLQLLRYAQEFAVNQQTKDRVKENIKGIENWAKTAPIKKEFEFIISKLNEFRNSNDSIENAKNLVLACKPQLQSMKNSLDCAIQEYLNLSTAVVNNALGMVVGVVNKAMEKRSKYVEFVNKRNESLSWLRNDYEHNLYVPEYSLEDLKNVIKEALSATKLIGSLDMHSEQQTDYNKNKDSLKSIASQLRISSRNSGGCYIATMAYGDYEHSQVIKLRKFRDNTLDQTLIGKLFIRFYYFISPKFVELFKNQRITNAIIRKILNLFIKFIRI